MKKAGIIGSGNVGANAAFFIAERGFADVTLYDIQEGLSRGKALDMMEAAPIRKYRAGLDGVDDPVMIAGSATVIIAAGRGCPVGGELDGLLDANWAAVRDIVGMITKFSPESVLIVATEPVDLITSLIARDFAVPRARLLGLGGIVDAARFRSAISRELSVSAEDISALVLGRHSGEMIIPGQYARVAGVPLESLLPAERIAELSREARDAGSGMAEIAECPGTYYNPSAAAAEVAEAVHLDMKRILPVSVELRGEYGIEGVALSLPCVVGRGGVEKAFAPPLTVEQERSLKRSAETMKEILAGVKP